MTLASSYTMLFVGPEAVCFVKKTFLPVDFLCCCFCINALSFGACCNFGVVTGCDSHRASTCHVKTKCLSVPTYLYFLRKATFPLNDST